MRNYKILEAETSEELENEVREHLFYGWILIGGLQVLHYNFKNEREGFIDSQYKFYQAVAQEGYQEARKQNELD